MEINIHCYQWNIYFNVKIVNKNGSLFDRTIIIIKGQ